MVFLNLDCIFEILTTNTSLMCVCVIHYSEIVLFINLKVNEMPLKLIERVTETISN